MLSAGSVVSFPAVRFTIKREFSQRSNKCLLSTKYWEISIRFTPLQHTSKLWQSTWQLWTLCDLWAVKQTHKEFYPYCLKSNTQPPPQWHTWRDIKITDQPHRHPVSEHESKRARTAEGKPMRVAVKCGVAPALWLQYKAHKHSFESQWTENALLCAHDRAAHCDQ